VAHLTGGPSGVTPLQGARPFGGAEPQIARDHFISHVLAALGALHPATRFFGGTALCRTYLEGTRLSEDVDLLHPDPGAFLDALAQQLPTALRREFPNTSWTQLPPEGDGRAGSLSPPDLSAIKIYVGRDGPDTASGSSSIPTSSFDTATYRPRKVCSVPRGQRLPL
jgi:hypothetical protein